MSGFTIFKNFIGFLDGDELGDDHYDDCYLLDEIYDSLLLIYEPFCLESAFKNDYFCLEIGGSYLSRYSVPSLYLERAFDFLLLLLLI